MSRHGKIVDVTLAGHVLVGRRATFRVEGEDRRGRVLGLRLNASGEPRGRLVVLHPDRWEQLERLLAREGRG